MPSPVFQAAGTATSSATATTAPAWPTHLTNDIAILLIECAGGDTPALTTANGFVRITGFPYKTGTTTLGTQIDAYWCRATSAAMAAPVVSDAGDHHYAIILTFRGCITSGNPWDATTGNVKAAADANGSITGVTTTVIDTCILSVITKDLDATAAFCSSWVNASTNTPTEVTDAGTIIGGGGGIGAAVSVKGKGGAVSATTLTVTSSINACAMIALKAPVVASSYRDLVLSETGLVGYWRLGDLTPGSIVPAGATNLDSDFNGVATAAPTTGSTGMLAGDTGTSILFNGTTQYITIPDAADFSLATTNALSIELWANVTSADSEIIIGKGLGASQNEWEIWQFAAATRITAYVYTLAGANIALADGAACSTGTRHIVVTMDNVGKHLLVYVDGVLGFTQDTWSGVSADGTTPVNIARRGDGTFFWNGMAQEVAIYNVVLTPQQVLNHFKIGRALFIPNIRRVSQAVNRGTY